MLAEDRVLVSVNVGTKPTFSPWLLRLESTTT